MRPSWTLNVVLFLSTGCPALLVPVEQREEIGGKIHRRLAQGEFDINYVEVERAGINHPQFYSAKRLAEPV
jgi:hypothetical protein